MDSELPSRRADRTEAVVQLPAPTAWPLILAFGITLICAGLLTAAPISILGVLLAVTGLVGWFRDVLPSEREESVPVLESTAPIVTSRREVARVEWLKYELHRARLPLEIYPVSAGVKGGLAGSVAMALLAMIYGVVSGHGIWYPINLLAAGFFPAQATTEQISRFHWNFLIIASAIHLTTSLLVGLLYGAMLPMFPRRPILLGGVIAPILWSGVLHSILEFINPVLSHRIHWFWFAISQMGFGIVAGIVVAQQERIPTWQHLPFAVRAGVEVPGAMDEKGREDRR